MSIISYCVLKAGAFSSFGLINRATGPPAGKGPNRPMPYGRATILVCLAVLLLLLFLFIFMPWLNLRRQEHAAMAWSGLVQIERLGNSMIAYSNAHDGCLPEARVWADSLIEFDANLSSSDFIHPSVKGPGSNFAFNQNLTGRRLEDVPKNVVLLFEADGPWNLAGGKELLRPRKGLDVYVCLVNGECYRFNFESWGIETYDPASPNMKIEPLLWEP